MLTRFRDFYERVSIPFGKASLSLHLSPDFWTFFSLAAALFAAILISQGQFLAGIFLVLVMNIADMMDGATARAGNLGTPFGTVLDHVCDRYGEFLIMGGIMAGAWVSPALGLFAASGIIMASYVRAKAESAGGLKNCVVGFAGRQEKLILLYAALLCFQLNLAVVAQVCIFLIGLLSHITAVQRLTYARNKILGSRL
jgi:phosphatidylglycerophosphate synthase